MSTVSVQDDRPAANRAWFGHPQGLAVLSGTELAERFSYYGMTAILVLYMVKQLLLPGHAENVVGLAALRRLFEFRGPMGDQAFASLIYGWYAGLVYFTPILGGMLADRFLGARRTVMLGALLMAAGHLAMSFDATFLLALLFLILGSGCLKGNISAQVAPLYPPEEESRRARGFTIFSTGINVGATIGPLVTGALAQAYGWHAGFACAAGLMLVALVVYASGQGHLRGKGEATQVEGIQAPLGPDEKRRIGALLLLVLANVPICMAYLQISNVGVVWVDRWVDLTTSLGTVPAAWFNSIDSFASIVVAAPLVALWSAQARRGTETDTLGKIVQGSMLNTIAPLLFAAGIFFSGGGKVGLGWVLTGWFLFGAAFMLYWPMTLGTIAAHAPRRYRSTLMGGSFLALFFGNVLLGWVGSFYEQMTPLQFWLLDAGIAFSAVIVLGLSVGKMRKILA